MNEEDDKYYQSIADSLNIILQKSTNGRYMYDVFKQNGTFICRIGASNFKYYRHICREMNKYDAYTVRDKWLKRYAKDCSQETLYTKLILWS